MVQMEIFMTGIIHVSHLMVFLLHQLHPKHPIS